MSNNIKTLKDRAKSFGAQLEIMEGRDKGETKELIGQVSTITDYGFISDEVGKPYAVFIVGERSEKFYFGGAVLSDRLLKLEEEGYHDSIVADGLPMLLTEEKSKKSNRTYTNVKFYPED